MTDFFKDIPCICFASNGDGHILAVNDLLCDFVQYTEAELLGSKVENIFTLGTRIFIQTHFYPLLQLKGHAEEIYITLKSKSGDDVPVLVNAVRKEEGDTVRLVFAGIAIDQRKKFEDEIIAGKKAAEKALTENTSLKAAQEELQIRAEELDRQISMVNRHNQELKQINHLTTHSLQEPVRKVLFFSSQMSETSENNVKEIATQKITKAARDMDAKLKGLQQYIWLTDNHIKFETLQLDELMESACKSVLAANKEITIQIDSDSMPAAEVNRTQISILFEELLLNAVRFRKVGHDVTINIQADVLLMNKFRQLPEKYKYAEFLKLQIRDDGLGFDDKYQEQAFELFRSLHPSGGRGVGLSLSKKIVENHQGSITLQSKPGVGTTVVILLPLQQ